MGMGSPFQAFLAVQSASAFCQKASEVGNPNTRKAWEHKYRLPVEIYGSPTPGWWPASPIVNQPAASKVLGISNCRFTTVYNAHRTCCGNTSSGNWCIRAIFD